MRFTLVDHRGAVSFRGPGHGLKALAAACSHGSASVQDGLAHVARLDRRWFEEILRGLAIFDELVVPDDPHSIDGWLRSDGPARPSTFRVLDERLRQMSLTPERLGVVLFNLTDRKIVQLVNSYAEIRRSDRGRVRIDGVPAPRYFNYALPDEWRILP